MPRYIGRNTDPSAWDVKKAEYENFLDSIVNVGNEIKKQDDENKNFFLKLADKGIDLDPEAQNYLSGFSKYFSGLGDWKKRKDQEEAPSMSADQQAPEVPKMPEMTKEESKGVTITPEKPKDKVDLGRLGAILDSGDFSKLKEEFPNEFKDMTRDQQDEFIKMLSPGKEAPSMPADQQVSSDIPPLFSEKSMSFPGMGELRAYEAGKIQEVPPYYEKLPMELLDISGTGKNQEIPSLLPKAPAAPESDEYGTGYLGSLARYSKSVRDIKGYENLTKRLKALKDAYGGTKDDALRQKYIVEAAKIQQEIDDKKKPWEKSREGQKALFEQDTRWNSPKDLSLSAYYDERTKKLKEGKSENPLDQKRFDLQVNREERSLANDITKIAAPLRRIDSKYSNMVSMNEDQKNLIAAGKEPNPANDLGLATLYLKLLDDMSVARETEVQTVIGMKAISSWFDTAYEKLKSGGFLLPDQRDNLLRTARLMARDAYKSNKDVLDNYRGLVQKNNFDIKIPSFENLDQLIDQSEGNKKVIDSANRILKDPKSSFELRQKARKALQKAAR